MCGGVCGCVVCGGADLLLRCWILPRHLNCPFTMMARRVHRASHSSMLWEVSTMQRPS